MSLNMLNGMTKIGNVDEYYTELTKYHATPFSWNNWVSLTGTRIES